MKTVRQVLNVLYLGGLIAIMGFAVIGLATDRIDLAGALHLAYYFPALAMLFVISAQTTLLESIIAGGAVDIRARMWDFIHWLLLIGINVGAWLHDGVTIWWFILKILLLAVIGWEIGAGVARRFQPMIGEIATSTISALIALTAGLYAGYLRAIDTSPYGVGWRAESLTAVISTLIVIKVISRDLGVMKRDCTGYRRAFILKGIACNTLILLFWVHLMAMRGFSAPRTWWLNLGVTFNVLVGNAIYLYFWWMYERCRRRQLRHVVIAD